jgi:hypothetical protein
MDRSPEANDAARQRAREQLDAAGVPRWAQQGDPLHNEAQSGRYYAWVENGTLHGRLLTRPDADEATAIADLLKQCDHVLTQDESAWPPANDDLTQPVAVLIVRPNGSGYGRLSRGTDLRPLQDLINHARDELALRQ